MTEEFITIQELKENMGIKEEPAKAEEEIVEMCGYCGKLKMAGQHSACEHSNSAYVQYTGKIIPKEELEKTGEYKKKNNKGRKIISFIGNMFFVAGWIILALLFSEYELMQGINYPRIVSSISVIFIGAILMWQSRSKK